MPKLNPLRVVEFHLADLLDDLVELRRRPALPVARRLDLACRGDEVGMPAVEEEREVGVTAPGFHAPADRNFKVTTVAPREESRLGVLHRDVDAEIAP